MVENIPAVVTAGVLRINEKNIKLSYFAFFKHDRRAFGI